MSNHSSPTPPEQERLAAVARWRAQGPSAIPQLIGELVDPSWVVRRAVVSALAQLGEPAIDPLLSTLREKRDHEGRIAASVDALVLSVGEVEGAILQLQEAEPSVLADVAQILGRRRKSASVPMLAQLAEHPDDTVSVAALEGLGRIGGRAAVDSLVRASESGNFFRTFPAIDVLGRSEDPRAIAPLVRLLRQPQYTMEAARALSRTGARAAVVPLAELATSGGRSTARVAAVALDELLTRHEERFGERERAEEVLRTALDSDPAVLRIGELLHEAEPSEQSAICRVLGALRRPVTGELLLPLLGSRAPGVAAAAANALRQVGGGAEGPLISALRRGGVELRLAVLPLLKSRSAAREVALALADASAEVRAAACETLGRLLDPATLPSLFERLRDASAAVNQAALASIQAFSLSDVEPLATQAARSDQLPVRRAALRILSSFGSPASLPIFLRALSDPDSRVRDSGIQGLALLEAPEAVESLLQVTRAPIPPTRASAMRALGMSLGGTSIEAALLGGLKDSDPWVRYYACQSLGRLRVTAALGAIEERLVDPAPHVRLAAVEALSHFTVPRALEALRRAARDPDEDLQRGALVGLGIAADPSTLPLLIEAAHGPVAATRLVALSSMAAFPSPTVVVELALAMRDPDETVRSTATSLLAGREELQATTELVAALSDPETRPLAIRALMVPAPGRIPGILEAVPDADPELAAELVSALNHLPGPEAWPAVLAMLRSPNPAARRAAAPVVAGTGSRDGLALVRDLSEQDPDPEVRRVCTLLLAQ